VRDGSCGARRSAIGDGGDAMAAADRPPAPGWRGKESVDLGLGNSSGDYAVLHAKSSSQQQTKDSRRHYNCLGCGLWAGYSSATFFLGASSTKL
jgi:hypothetical protein